MRTRYRYRDGQTVDADGLPMLNQEERAREPQAPYAISDTQAAVQAMTNGRIYDSKSEMRKEYRRAGVVEVGSEKLKPGRDPYEVKQKRKTQRNEIKGALHRAHSRMGFGAP